MKVLYGCTNKAVDVVIGLEQIDSFGFAPRPPLGCRELILDSELIIERYDTNIVIQCFPRCIQDSTVVTGKFAVMPRDRRVSFQASYEQ